MMELKIIDENGKLRARKKRIVEPEVKKEKEPIFV
jgi:hypothetical protein